MPQLKGAHFKTEEDLTSMYEAQMLTEEEYNQAKLDYFGGKKQRSMVPDKNDSRTWPKGKIPKA